MKTIKSYLIAITFLATTYFTFAQTSENPWAIAVGADLINLQGDNVDSGFNFGAPALSLSRYLAAGFSIGAQYALNKVDNKGTDYKYTSLDGVLKYNLTEGNITPYLFAGYGFSRFADNVKREGFFPSTETSRTILGGIGAHFFLDDNWAINASTSYRSAHEKYSYKHLQHVIGLSYHFGAGDADKDGVSDQKDECPDVPGLKEFNGCPDTDGDGIPDSKDRCPDEAGSAEHQGCPDTDGDGVPNVDDACPDKAGTAQMNGCPDSDGDGVADNVDRCPETAGEVANGGCPWTDSDGDGVIDRDDKCPNVAGKATNGGCPDEEVPTDLINFLASDKGKILFNSSSASLDRVDKSILDELKALLDKYPYASIRVEGHASSDGGQSYNQTLSEKRAAAVKEYLTNKGITGNRINTIGYGETRPVDDNNTLSGRINNRRVELNRSANITVE